MLGTARKFCPCKGELYGMIKKDVGFKIQVFPGIGFCIIRKKAFGVIVFVMLSYLVVKIA